MPLLILIAEDDPGIRLAVNDYLEASGYSTIAAEDGDRALSMLEKYHPHLLICDIKMPGKNGYELVQSIRQLPKFRLLPVIFLTEHKEMQDRIRGYQAGCDIYLPKPFEIEELGAVIRNLLERSQIIHSELIFSSRNQILKSNNSHSYPLENGHAKLFGNETQPKATNDRSESKPRYNSHSEVSSEFISPSVTPLANIDLTKRETEVLSLLVNGSSNIEIGNQLHLSHRTIEKYVSSLLRKTDKNNRAELIRYTLEHHLLN